MPISYSRALMCVNTELAPTRFKDFWR
jgi:hypothetical protein